MKAEDFERLKAVCEKEGFEITGMNSPDVWHITKKDIWEGVEFLSVVGFDKIYKIKGISNDVIFVEPDMCFTKSVCVPSTEQSYFEQLKREAFERFGEIKEGDEFTSVYETRKINTIDWGIGFFYGKEDDYLSFNGWPIYKQGKWATKIKERVKVEPTCVAGNEITFKVSNKINSIEMYDLASQLESYLNGEIE